MLLLLGGINEKYFFAGITRFYGRVKRKAQKLLMQPPWRWLTEEAKIWLKAKLKAPHRATERRLPTAQWTARMPMTLTLTPLSTSTVRRPLCPRPCGSSRPTRADPPGPRPTSWWWPPASSSCPSRCNSSSWIASRVRPWLTLSFSILASRWPSSSCYWWSASSRPIRSEAGRILLSLCLWHLGRTPWQCSLIWVWWLVCYTRPHSSFSFGYSWVKINFFKVS